MKYKIIASLTTTPSRINLIFPVIRSILNQTIPIDSIEINVPHKFKKTGEDYVVPKWLLELCEETANSSCPVRVFRTEDYGPSTKVVPTLIRHKNKNFTYIWSVDDDFEYPHNMLAVLYREFDPGRLYILSHSGGRWKYTENTTASITGYYSSRKEGFVNFLEGFATVLYPTKVIEEDFEEYINTVCDDLDSSNSDDIVLSNYFKGKKVTIYNCAYPYDITRPLLQQKASTHSETSDALHNQGGGNTERYIRVYDWLREQGLNNWCK